uniref:SCAN box domain-containing protein n=1 Tax=Astyanax mexicanus TaxID=7994 RepID=A0A3B1K627_ASTMX
MSGWKEALLRTGKCWLQPEQLGPEAVTERVVMDHYLRSLPLELRKAVGLRNPTSAKEMFEATEMAESVLSLSRPEKKESASSGRPDLFGPTRPELKPHVHNLPRPRFFGPRPREPALSPQDEPMPTKPEPSPSQPQGPKAWLAGCRQGGSYPGYWEHRHSGPTHGFPLAPSRSRIHPTLLRPRRSKAGADGPGTFWTTLPKLGVVHRSRARSAGTPTGGSRLPKL